MEQFNQSNLNSSFIPFGGFGIIEGTSICLFIYIGLDHVSSSKTTNSRGFLGLITFLLAFLFILASCIILTLLLPYYEQVHDLISN